MFKKILLFVFKIAVCLLFIATLFGYFAITVSFAEYLVSFRPLFFFVGLAALIISRLIKHQPSLVMSIGVILLNGFEIAPYFLPKQNPEQHNVSLLFYNVDKNRMPLVGADEVIELVEHTEPQVAVLREVGEPVAKRITSHFSEAYPFQFDYQHAKNDGVLILSQFPMTDVHIEQLGGGRPVAFAELDVYCQNIHLVAPHPNNPFHNISERNNQLHAIADYVAIAPKPLLVVGDLNVTMWSGWYKQIENSGVENVRKGNGIMPTWRVPGFGFTVPFVYFPLDHTLVSEEIRVYSAEALPSPGSDHQPLLSELWIEPQCA